MSFELSIRVGGIEVLQDPEQPVITAVSTGLPGPPGPVGPPGPPGAAGEPGSPGQGLFLLGAYDTIEELETAHPTGAAGDVWVVGDNLYLWEAAQWSNRGPWRGPPGDVGATGPQGPAGAAGAAGSAGATGTAGAAGHSPVLTWTGDQIAVDGVASGPHLTGPTGATGPQGAPGIAPTIKGSNTYAYITGLGSPALNDLWIQTDSGGGGVPGDGLLWNGSAWVNVGLIRGPTGPTGATGPAGTNGTNGAAGAAGHSPVLTWVGDQLAIDGVVGGPHLTGPQGRANDFVVTCTLNGDTALTAYDRVIYRVPALYAGYRITAVAASCDTGSTTGPVFAITKNGTSMLSTALSIDAGETDSATAATAAVINAAVATVATGDRISITPSNPGALVFWSQVGLTFTSP